MERLSKWYFPLFTILLVIPLIFTSSTMYPWLFGKTVLFNSIIELMALGFLVWGWSKKTIQIKKIGLLEKGVLIFFGLLFVTALFGENFSLSWWSNQARALGVFTWLHVGLFYFFLTQTLREEKQWTRLLSVSMWGGVVVGLSAVFQKFLPAAWNGDVGGDRYSGILGNPAFFASFVLVECGIAFFLFLKERKRLRFLYLLGGIFLGFCVLMSGIRGAFAGLLVGTLFFVLANFFLKPTKKSGWIIRGVSLLLFIIFIGVFFFAPPQKNTTGYLPFSIARLQNFSWKSGTGETRLMAWKIALHGLKEKPYLGWGWGNYNTVFNKYYNPKFFQYSFQETMWDKPHNAFLEMFVSGGIPLGLAYLGVFATFGFALFSSLKGKSQEYKRQNFMLASAIIAYGVQNVFLFDTPLVLIPFFLLLGFITFEHDHSKGSVSMTSLDGRSYLVFPLFFLIGTFLITGNVRMWRQSYSLKETLQAPDIFTFSPAVEKTIALPGPFQGETAVLIANHFTELEKANAFSKGNFQFAQKGALATALTLEKKSEEFPSSLEYPLWGAQVYMILAQFQDEMFYDQAIKLLERAQNLAPQKQEIYFLLGRVYILKKDFKNALLVQEKAVALDPNIGQSIWFLGLTKVASGDVEGGLVSMEESFQKRFEPSIDQRLYVIDLYAQLKNYKKIIEHYKILVQRQPDEVNWYVRLATAYALDGNKAEALKTVQIAVGMYPTIKADADKFIEQYKLN